MDLAWVLIGLSAVVLVAYLFDFLGHFIRVPAVVLLLFAGLALRVLTDALGWEAAIPAEVLPILGTLGLILIVLEGALDLRLSREATGLITRSAGSAIFGILITGSLLTAVFAAWFDAPWQAAAVHALPLAVISSAVAIPAAAALSPRLREFVVYESSISDIVGVVLFYALLEKFSGVGPMLVSLTGEIVLSIIVGLIVGLGIYLLIQRIQHHVRVLPMIFGITLLYGLGKILHLAPLVMVVLVGLVLNNAGLLKGRLQPSTDFEADLNAFKHLTAEFTFVVRSFFFVMLGFSTAPGSLFDTSAWILTALALICSLAPRMALLRWVVREPTEPLIWFAPRGLITVLLFLSIPTEFHLTEFPLASLMLIILVWALLLTTGVLRHGAATKKVQKPEQ